MSLFVQESFVDNTRGGRYGDSEVYESRFETSGELYKFCLQEYGRCTGKIHVDIKGGEVGHIGWTFLRSEKYEGSDERYLREVWVTVHDAPPEKTTSYKYHFLDGRR